MIDTYTHSLHFETLDNQLAKVVVYAISSANGVNAQQQLACLSDIERQRYLSFLADKRQKEFLLGRYCAKQAIAKQNDIRNLSEVTIENGIFGQPVINHPDIQNIRVSLSHSGNVAIAIAFPEAYPMAVDVEEVNTAQLKTVKTKLQETEITLWDKNYLSLAEYCFFLWSAKEALSKILKTGLTSPLTLFEIKDVKCKGNAYICTFKHFPQYQCMGTFKKGYIYSFVYPKQIIFKGSGQLFNF